MVCHASTVVREFASPHTVRPVKPRICVGVRVSRHAHDYLQKVADEHGITKSEVGRAMFAVAARHEDELGRQIEAIKQQP